MMIKNLSKSDYYKSRNIHLPKPVSKLTPQPPVRNHLIEPLQTLAVEIKRHIENKKNLQNKQLDHLGYEQVIHELQVRIQDLNKILLNKEDYIQEIHGQKEKNIRRITYLQRQIFDLQAQLLKVQYEYKTTIQFIKTQNQTQRNDWQQKIIFLQAQLRKQKQNYETQLYTITELNTAKLNSYSGTKQSLKNVSEQLMNGFKKDMDYYIIENKRLKNELILSQNKSIQKLRFYHQENFQLKDKIDERQLEYSLHIMKFNTQIDLKNTQILQLNQRMQQMVSTFSKQRQRMKTDLFSLQRKKSEKQQKLKQTINEVMNQRAKLQKQIKCLTKLNIQLDSLSSQWEKRHFEIETKLSFVQLQKQQEQQKYQTKISELKQNHKFDIEAQINIVNKNYLNRLNSIQRQLELKIQESSKINQKYIKIARQLEDKIYRIKVLQQKQKSDILFNQQSNLKIQSLTKECQKIKNYLTNLTSQHQTQKLQIKISLNNQRQQEIQIIKTNYNQIIQNLKTKIKQTETKYQIQISELKIYTQNIKSETQILKKQHSQIKKQKQQINAKYESFNNFYQKQQIQHKKYVHQLKRLIEAEAEALKKNTQNVDHIKNQYQKLSFQLQAKQTELERLHKQIKQAYLQQDRLKLQSVRKCSEIQEQMRSNFNKLQKQKNELSVLFKKAEGQIRGLNSKLENSQFLITNLKSENNLYLSQTQRLKEAYAQKQQITNNLLQELNAENKILVQKQNYDLKIKLQTVQIKNQELLQEINTSRQFNNHYQIQVEEILQIKTQKQEEIEILKKKLQEKLNEKKTYEQKIINLCTKILQIQVERKRFQSQIKILEQKLSKYEQNMIEMKKSNIYQSDLMLQIKSRNSRLLILNEQQRMEIQFQLNQNETLKSLLNRAQQQLQVTKNQHFQLKQLSQKTKQQQEGFEQKIKQVKVQYERKNRQLLEKIILIEDKINLKDKQITNYQQLIEENTSTINQLKQKEAQCKKHSPELMKYRRDTQQLIKQFEKCLQALKKSEQHVQALQEYVRNQQTKHSNIIKQLQSKSHQFAKNLLIMTHKCEIETKKGTQLKNALQSIMTRFKDQKNYYNNEIIQLKKQLKQHDHIKDQIKFDIKAEYEDIFNKYKNQRQQLINGMTEQHQKIIKQLRQEISDLSDQKTRIKNEFYTYKVKADEELTNVQNQVLLLHQTINKMRRTSEYLLQYKKRWDKISGQVKEYENLDSLEIKQIDLSFTQSIKSSIIIDKPYFPLLELKEKQYIATKAFFETPETAQKEARVKMQKYRYQDIDKYE